MADVFFKQGKIKEAITSWERSLSEWAVVAPSEKDDKEVAKIQKKLDGAKVRLTKENGAKPKR